nr:MAG TPA: hypothetical protein [Caudoviricetes sp.]
MPRCATISKSCIEEPRNGLTRLTRCLICKCTLSICECLNPGVLQRTKILCISFL